jgi:hypothetical protein
MLLSIINTKNSYPLIKNQYSEKTIYMAFIYFCKFKSLIPIHTDLLPICLNKPDIVLINKNDSLERIIQKLKNNGKRLIGMNVRVPTSLDEFYLPEKKRLYKSNQER